MSKLHLSTTKCKHNKPILHCGTWPSHISSIHSHSSFYTCNSALNTEHYYSYFLAAIWHVIAVVISLNIIISRLSNYSKFWSFKLNRVFNQKLSQTDSEPIPRFFFGGNRTKLKVKNQFCKLLIYTISMLLMQIKIKCNGLHIKRLLSVYNCMHSMG